MLLTKQLAGQKHCNFYRENTEPTHYTKTRKALGLAAGVTQPPIIPTGTEATMPSKQESSNSNAAIKRKLCTPPTVKEEKENVCCSGHPRAKVTYIEAEDSDMLELATESTPKKAWVNAEGDHVTTKDTPKQKSS